MVMKKPPQFKGSTMQVETPTCIFCGKGGWVTVPIAGYNAWRDGAFIQNALPQLTPGQREQLINGTHDECFNKNIPED